MLFQLLRSSSLWHADADSNLVGTKPELYKQLAEWSVEDAKKAVSSEPNRWAQALLLRLLAPSPKLRPASMAAVLEHPFLHPEETFEAPALGDGEKSHIFLSHFGENAVRAAAAGCAERPP